MAKRSITGKTFKIVLIYFVLGVLYIIYSDKIVSNLFADPDLLSKVQTYKGLAFILATSFLLYLLVLRELRMQEKMSSLVRESESKYKNLVETASDAMYLISEDGIILETNQFACKLTGRSKGEIVGAEIELVDPNFTTKSFVSFWQKVPPDVPQRIETTHVKKDGTVFPVEVNGKKYMLENKAYYLGIARDITERKQAEENLIRQKDEYKALTDKLKQMNEELLIAKQKAEESDHLKSVFLNNMSHEIRTPMNGIIGFSEFLMNDNIPPEKRRDYTTIIINSSKQLLRIIDDILEISQLETKQVKIHNMAFSLNDVLKEQYSIFSLTARKQNLPFYLKNELPDEQSHIISDKSKLIKVISNLLENALKYTSTGFVEMGYHKRGDTIELYVKDTGIGISPENVDRIFQRFIQEDVTFSRKDGGLGIGLSIAKENTNLLGGEIRVISEKGKGSTFYVSIPFIAVDIEKIEKPDVTQKKVKTAVFDRKTVLLVEDEEMNAIYIKELLQDMNGIGFNIIHVRSGKDAVDECRENQKIDVVLMDIKLPQLDGYTATAQIKQFLPDVPIIAQTAYSTNEDKEKAMTAGCDEFISKPINKENFFALLNKHLH